MITATMAPRGAVKRKKNHMNMANDATSTPSMLPVGFPLNTMNPANSCTIATISSTQPQNLRFWNRNAELMLLAWWMDVSPSTRLKAPAMTSQIAENIDQPVSPLDRS
jgi:hypothetical protein